MKNKTNRTLRKILSIALCLALVMSYVPMVSITAGAAATDITVTIDTGASVTLRDADGDDYYDIGTADELYAFAAAVNGGNTEIDGKLTANIVVNQNVLTADGSLNGDGSNFRVWTPIANGSSKRYYGIFNGNGKTVSGLYFNNTEIEFVGLFGRVDDNGKVQSVGVIDSYLSGRNYVAGVIGCVSSTTTVMDCYNTGMVNGDELVGGVIGYNKGDCTDCYNMGTVNGYLNVGGVIGYNKGDCIDSYNAGDVCGAKSVGGVIGVNTTESLVTKCYNTGSVNGTDNCAGGVIGLNSTDSPITNCYNTGTVNGNTYTGGVIGMHYSPISNCYNTGTISGSTNVGGVVGGSTDIPVNCYYLDTCGAAGKGTSATAAQFASGEVAYLLGSDWGQTIGTDAYPVLGGAQVYYGYAFCDDTEPKYTNDENVSEGKPGHSGDVTYTVNLTDNTKHDKTYSCCGTVVTENHTGGTATCTTLAVCEACGASYGELDPDNHEYEKNNGICCDTYQPAELNESGYYEIGNAGQLFWFANYINTVDRTANAVLTADIDLENRPWTPIGSTGENSHNFRGIFDGQNHTIKGLYVEGGRAGLGFFGEVRTGTVKNFTIYGEVVANTEVNYVGGVIGSICGLNSTDHGLERNGAIIQNITSYVNLTAKTHGIGMIGGFVGYANHESLIEQCAWYGTFDAGIYRVDSGAGGFVGRIYDTATVTIRNCGAYGDIITAYKSGTYNNQATIYIGGFLSYSPSGANTVLENNLWAGRIINNTNLTAANAHLSAYGTMNSSASKTNCYALEGTPYVTTKDENDGGITTVTAEQLKSGEIAYLLQQGNTVQIWGQMSNTEGSLPIITDNELYKVVTVGETGNYSVANVGDTNGDGTVDVTDYQALVNKALADDHEQIETASYDDIIRYDLDGDGYLDVIDAYLLHLFINGFTTVDVYAVGDYDLNGIAFEEADIKAIKHAIENPEKLATYKKYASDINGDGKVSYDDLNTLTSIFPLYFVGEA